VSLLTRSRGSWHEPWDDRSARSTWVQAYAVLAFAVEPPYALKKLTRLVADRATQRGPPDKGGRRAPADRDHGRGRDQQGEEHGIAAQALGGANRRRSRYGRRARRGAQRGRGADDRDRPRCRQRVG
jgi:hypothetical protein